MPGAGESIDFSAWRDELRRVVEAGGTSDVPCGDCTACCRSRQFVQIDDDELETLAQVDSRLLVRNPTGSASWILGYDAAGRCPMLGDGGCTIYHDRPRTCRTYDCRVYAASGVRPPQPLVAARVQSWIFAVDDQLQDCRRRAAELSAAGAPPLAAALRALLK